MKERRIKKAVAAKAAEHLRMSLAEVAGELRRLMDVLEQLPKNDVGSVTNEQIEDALSLGARKRTALMNALEEAGHVTWTYRGFESEPSGWRINR